MTAKAWAPPADLDPECRALCVALNKLPGIETFGSCCGHGRTPFFVLFTAQRLTALREVVFLTTECRDGWRVEAQTKSVGFDLTFVLEGPVGAYENASAIAQEIEATMKPPRPSKRGGA